MLHRGSYPGAARAVMSAARAGGSRLSAKRHRLGDGVGRLRASAPAAAALSIEIEPSSSSSGADWEEAGRQNFSAVAGKS